MRKREAKQKHKDRVAALEGKEKVKFRLDLLAKLKDEYVTILQQQLMEPEEFAQKYTELSQDHAYVLFNYWPKFRDLYAAANAIMQPRPVDEKPIDTLRDYLEHNSVGDSPIQCAHLINNAGHAPIMRSVWHLLLK